MKKNVLKTIALSLSTIALVSCGGTGTTDSGHGDTGGTTGKKISFWHCIGHDKMNNLQHIIDKFNEEHAKTDGYQIVPEKIAGDYDSLHDAVKTKLQAGFVPSITMGYPDSFSEYIGNQGAEKSKILNLDNFIKDDANFHPETFVTEYYEEGTGYQYSGTYSLPLYKSTEAMYINLEMFHGSAFYAAHKDDSYGSYGAVIGNPDTWDWDTLVYVGSEIQKELGSTISDFHAIGYDSDANLFISQMAQRGIPYTSKETPNGKSYEHYLFKDPNTGVMNENLVNFATDIFDLTQAGTLATKGSYGSYSSDLFLSKKTMITIGSTGGSVYNDPIGSTNAGFHAGLYAVPAYKGKENAKYIMQGPSICFFNTKDTTKEKVAWEFYSQFLSDPEMNAQVALENSYDPVRATAYETDSYKQYISYAGAEGKDNINAQMDYRIPLLTKTLKDDYYATPVFNGSGNARKQMDTIIKKAQGKKDATSKEKIAKALEEVYNACISYK